jgi:hypothetical protein
MVTTFGLGYLEKEYNRKIHFSDLMERNSPREFEIFWKKLEGNTVSLWNTGS